MANSKKRCKYCKKYFPAETMISPPAGTFCSFDHATKWAEAERDRKRKEDASYQKDFQRRLRNGEVKKKQTLTPMKKAQMAFNAFIRFIDRHRECISCDKPIHEIEKADGWKPGGAFDCGHYMEVGSHPELRFDEDNAHRQCKSCNAGAGNYTKKKRSVDDRYRQKLVEKISLDRVQRLEGPNEPKRYRDSDYLEIEKLYKKKLKEAKANDFYR